MIYKEAADIAVSICKQLQGHCERVNIAGSIRRQKKEVGDIEIICIPKLIKTVKRDMFQNEEATYSNDPKFNEIVLGLGQVLKGKTVGRMMQIKLPQDITLDLFMPDPADYYRQYAIRTGSADYSHKVIAQGWLDIGWCGVPGLGLRKVSDCKTFYNRQHQKEWKCINDRPELPPIWESEQEFFDWIKVPFIHPKDRNV